MKTPVMMLEDIAAEIIENISLFEVIFRNMPDHAETDCATACLIRSMYKTLDKANEYIEKVDTPPAGKERH